MSFPIIGDSEKQDTSKYQVTLVNKKDKSIHPVNYPRMNRFFDNESDRNAFVNELQLIIRKWVVPLSTIKE